LKTLGVGRVALIGHDRGARVATRLVKDHPDLVDRLVVMDNVPTRIVAREMNARVAREYWFFMFHQIPDLPEDARTSGFVTSSPTGATTQ